VTVDTLAITKKLEAAGIDRRQAEAISEAIRDGSKGDLDEAVTRLEAKISSEVTRLEAKISSEVTRLEAKITSEIAGLEARMIRLMLGQVAVFAGIVAVIAGLFKLFG
jgi:phage host-nuclease inhibitor protein Gam